jgi:hypothetical protein
VNQVVVNVVRPRQCHEDVYIQKCDH